MTPYINRQHVIGIGGLLLLVSCSSDWNDHYDARIPETTLAQALQGSRFADLVKAAGYEATLDDGHTYTVFAPTDEALSSVDLSDATEVRRIVRNHIAPRNYSSSTPSTEGVRMDNGKLLYFKGNTFGGATLAETDLICHNGIIHRLSSQIPYSYNIHEYVSNHGETAMLNAFVTGKDTLFSDPAYTLGAIADEDSVFTMAIPTDKAWQEAYERISPYFNAYDADKAVADSVKDIQTSLAILSDLIFRGRIDQPASHDSLVTTSGSVIHDPVGYFSGMTPVNASNGMIWIAEKLNYNNWETWNKEISVESEEQQGRTPARQTALYVRNAETYNPLASQISGLRYLEVTQTATSVNPGVTFDIPDVLSGAYDIYASFVPTNITDTSASQDSTRIQFSLTYVGANGRNTTKTFKESDFLTSGDKMTLIKVCEAFEFPVSNYYDRMWFLSGNDTADRVTTTKLLVQTNVTTKEFNQNILRRRFLIDRIYLVPVKR